MFDYNESWDAGMSIDPKSTINFLDGTLYIDEIFHVIKVGSGSDRDEVVIFGTNTDGTKRFCYFKGLAAFTGQADVTATNCFTKSYTIEAVTMYFNETFLRAEVFWTNNGNYSFWNYKVASNNKWVNRAPIINFDTENRTGE
jgi:hypothetical protein